MRSPALVVVDGTPGIGQAVRELWPVAERQRSAVHVLRSLTSKLPQRHHNELNARYWRVLESQLTAELPRDAITRNVGRHGGGSSHWFRSWALARDARVICVLGELSTWILKDG
jgi:transposase-like protein